MIEIYSAVRWIVTAGTMSWRIGIPGEIGVNTLITVQHIMYAIYD